MSDETKAPLSASAESTPRTDALATRCVGEGSPMSYVRAIDFCRHLERELNYLTAKSARSSTEARK